MVFKNLNLQNMIQIWLLLYLHLSLPSSQRQVAHQEQPVF
jgi:hypothetical protein